MKQNPKATHHRRYVQSIKRRDFLERAISTGALITVPGLLSACAGTQGRLPGNTQDPIESAKANGFDEPILVALNCGITAPNPHNTQAWKFRIISDTACELYVDETRILPLTDPPARQIHIGQGTLLEHTRIGALQMGYDTRIRLFPRGEYSHSEIGAKPVARIDLIANSQVARDPLYASIKKRATNRTEYDGPLITNQEINRLQAMIGTTHSSLETTNDRVRIQKIADLAFSAMEIETRTISRADESRQWFRVSDDEIYTKRDGISLRGNGMSGFMLWMARTFFVSTDHDTFHAEANQNAYLDSYRSVVDTSRAFVMLRTRTNTQTDWVRTGMDYARLQLALTSMGLVMHPVSQVLQEYLEMDNLRSEFETLVEQKPGEKIQMLVRVGRSDYFFASPRRSLAEMREA